eukprot:CAMPEP_0113719640 /NCGR_PEP_ID=MMETSP0038_2-20120614/35954_1 /TAXON_ID=2898 /ORGANISM="Cryptomonas paramecium" /LENGTH=204 /DNA_ID=CAMNT_0000648089 /DNA_START=88 /DNA_END=702 /DNA_ORIENTATION=+ /assembly_acc=CAM_ASM_000170
MTEATNPTNQPHLSRSHSAAPREFDNEFALAVDRVDDDMQVAHQAMPCRTLSTCAAAWYKRQPPQWCGFLMKRARGPLAMWSRRLFELRQPALSPSSSHPILVYLSSSLKRDVVMRVKNVRHAMDADGKTLVLTLDVVDVQSEDDEVGSGSRRMVLSVPDDARESHFHTKLLLLVEAGRTYRGECARSGSSGSEVALSRNGSAA